MPLIKGMHARLLADQMKDALSKKGYAFFVSGDYNVNVIGVRSSSRRANYFDDVLYLLYKKNDEWHVLVSELTTDPGWTYLKAGSSQFGSKGTAILVPDQYRGCYKLDKHNGQYTALCQRLGPVSVYRDNDRDMELDLDPATIETGNFSINIHRAARTGEVFTVDSYSAGCQVFKNKTDFDEFIKILTLASEKWGNKFTYTLIDEGDLT